MAFNHRFSTLLRLDAAIVCRVETSSLQATLSCWLLKVAPVKKHQRALAKSWPWWRWIFGSRTERCHQIGRFAIHGDERWVNWPFRSLWSRYSSDRGYTTALELYGAHFVRGSADSCDLRQNFPREMKLAFVCRV